MRSYDAIVLDLDGTLLNDRGEIPPRTHRALSKARAEGVVVMLAERMKARVTFHWHSLCASRLVEKYTA